MTAPQQTALEVFLSHASADREHVELVRGQIEALGIGVYLAEHDHRPGTPLADKVRGAVQRADLVVVLVTSTSVNSSYVQQEIGFALAHNKPVIPIVDFRIAREIDLGMLAGVEYVFLDVAHPAEAMQHITASLHAILRPAALPVIHPQPSPPARVPGLTGLSDTEKLMLGFALVLVAFIVLSEGGGGA